MHPEAKIVRAGELHFSDLTVRVVGESNRKIDSNLEETAREEWITIKADAESKGLKPWDGRYYRIENLAQVEQGSYEVIISDSIRYSQLRAFQKLKVSERYSLDYHTLHISTIGFVETKDNKIVFGFRKNTLNNSSYTLIGGGLQPDEITVNSATDIEANIYKEINEELRVNKSEIEKLALIGLVHAIERMNFYFVFHAKVSLTEDQLIRRFPVEEEHDSLVFIESSKLDDFVADKPDYMKACARLMM